MLTVRLSPESQKDLETLSERKGLSKSDIVKIALEQYVARENADNPYELGMDLFGLEGSPRIAADPPGTYKASVKSKINQKHRAKHTD